MHVYTVCINVCMYVWLYVCMYACMYACMYVCMVVCMDVIRLLSECVAPISQYMQCDCDDNFETHAHLSGTHQHQLLCPTTTERISHGLLTPPNVEQPCLAWWDDDDDDDGHDDDDDDDGHDDDNDGDDHDDDDDDDNDYDDGHYT